MLEERYTKDNIIIIIILPFFLVSWNGFWTMCWLVEVSEMYLVYFFLR